MLTIAQTLAIPTPSVKNVGIDIAPEIVRAFMNGLKILMVAAVAGLFFTAAHSVPRNFQEPQTP